MVTFGWSLLPVFSTGYRKRLAGGCATCPAISITSGSDRWLARRSSYLAEACTSRDRGAPSGKPWSQRTDLSEGATPATHGRAALMKMVAPADMLRYDTAGAHPDLNQGGASEGGW